MDTGPHHEVEDPDIVSLLVLEAGRLMEDASPDFALKLPETKAERGETLNAMLEAAAAIHSLMTAAVAANNLHGSRLPR